MRNGKASLTPIGWPVIEEMGDEFSDSEEMREMEAFLGVDGAEQDVEGDGVIFDEGFLGVLVEVFVDEHCGGGRLVGGADHGEGWLMVVLFFEQPGACAVDFDEPESTFVVLVSGVVWVMLLVMGGWFLVVVVVVVAGAARAAAALELPLELLLLLWLDDGLA